MQKPPLDPDVDDLAPTDAWVTVYDEEHIITYLGMLDAAAEDADWREVSRIVLHINPRLEPDRARRAYDSPSRTCPEDEQYGLSIFAAWRSEQDRQLGMPHIACTIGGPPPCQ
jgi:hypothetical protein